jgi:hypothetical protein
MPNFRKNRLKNKLWNICNIKIDHWVAQYKEGAMTTNKTIAFLVKIKTAYGTQIMFRADSVKDLWKMIKYETMISKF